MKEKLKQAAGNVMAVFDWVGSHLTGLLTIGSLVLGFLFIKQREKAQSLETDLELKNKAAKVEKDKEKVNASETEANDSLANYNKLKSDYDKS
jgi:hypothetical protein